MIDKKMVNDIIERISKYLRLGDNTNIIIDKIFNEYSLLSLKDMMQFMDMSRIEQMKLVSFDNIQFIIRNIVVMGDVLKQFKEKFEAKKQGE